MTDPDTLQQQVARCVAHGLAAINAAHPRAAGPRATVSEEEIADVIADLLHLAASVDLDPDDVLDHGRTYYHYDQEGPLP